MIQESGPAKGRPTLRLFTGIAAPPDIDSRLDDLIWRLKPLARIRWSPASNFHITTKFIGAWPQDRLHDMKTALATLMGVGTFRIGIGGLGFFPNARHPRIFWTGVEGGAPLASLASQTDQACAKLGVEQETKPYSPHLTLARIDSPAALSALHEALGKLPSAEFGEFEATAFHLYLSEAGRGGSVYTSLAEFPL
jgi:RNA 2',3'-cyclic 3'-phosphodiesterase